MIVLNGQVQRCPAAYVTLVHIGARIHERQQASYVAAGCCVAEHIADYGGNGRQMSPALDKYLNLMNTSS